MDEIEAKTLDRMKEYVRNRILKLGGMSCCAIKEYHGIHHVLVGVDKNDVDFTKDAEAHLACMLCTPHVWYRQSPRHREPEIVVPWAVRPSCAIITFTAVKSRHKIADALKTFISDQELGAVEVLTVTNPNTANIVYVYNWVINIAETTDFCKRREWDVYAEKWWKEEHEKRRQRTRERDAA